MMAANPDMDLLTIAEAAELLKVSTVTLHRWLKEGRIPVFRLGPRQLRLRRRDLAKLLVPASREEMEAPVEATSIEAAIRPLTEEDVQRRLEAIRQSEDLIGRMRARRGGEPVPSSWPLIRRAREERSKRT